MKDIDSVREMLTRAQIPFTEINSKNFAGKYGDKAVVGLQIEQPNIDERPEGGALYGYAGFFTQFLFDADGGLVAMGIWE